MTEQYIEELIRKYAEGVATDEEIQQLNGWYRSARIGHVQWPSSRQAEKEIVSRRILDRLKNEISPKRSQVVHFPWLKIAAVLLLSVGVATSLIYLLKPSEGTSTTIKNPSGRIQLVTLPDGSKVWLNASTNLSYPSSFVENRKAKLEGEAYFEITHDAGHPFTVEGGGVQTIVLGTSFNIKALKSGTKTTVSVISGKVKVRNSSGELGVLLPSDQLRFDRQIKTAYTASIDTNNVLAWRNGKLQFDGETFAEIALILENWYNIKILFAETGIAKCRYYMSVENTISLDKLLTLLSEVTKIGYVYNKDRTTVTIKGEGCR